MISSDQTSSHQFTVFQIISIVLRALGRQFSNVRNINSIASRPPPVNTPQSSSELPPPFGMTSPSLATATLTTSCHVVGLFVLANGTRSRVPETLCITATGQLRVNGPSWYGFYHTRLHCTHALGPVCVLRIPSPLSHVTHCSNMLAVVFGELLAPSRRNNEAFIDASRVHLIPRNSRTARNENYHSSFNTTYIFAVGIVSGPPHAVDETHVRFPVTITQYIRDAERRFQLMCPPSLSVHDRPHSLSQVCVASRPPIACLSFPPPCRLLCLLFWVIIYNDIGRFDNCRRKYYFSALF
jgi:hypothetical protein